MGRRALEDAPDTVIGGVVDLRAQLLGATDELSDRPFLERSQNLLATLLDESSKALHRPGRGISALLLLVDDLRERHFGEVVLGAIVEDLDLLAIADQLGDPVEGDVLAVAGVIELAIRIALDHPNLFRLSHWLDQASPATHCVKLALLGALSRLVTRGCQGVERTTSFEDLFRRLARLGEIEMRVGLICEQLEGLSDDDAVQLLHEAHLAAVLGGADAQRVFLALGWALFEPRVQPRRTELGTAARRAELHQVADFVMPPLENDTLVEDKRRIPDLGRGRPLTLGERKSLARTHDRGLIQRVVRDPHPDVVRILLGNPSLTEDDVIRICAARPNDPDVLHAVYRNRRWVVRYRPRNTILRNPDTPLDTALLLAPLLRKAELKEAASSSELAAAVRLSCKVILEKRDSQSQPDAD